METANMAKHDQDREERNGINDGLVRSRYKALERLPRRFPSLAFDFGRSFHEKRSDFVPRT